MSPPMLAIIVPTFNERDNLPRLIPLLDKVLGEIPWEAIIVDDNSPDGTAEVAREISRHDPRVRCLQRFGRRGLSSACIEGMCSTAAPYLAVMDGDLQHDESLLPQMLEELQADQPDATDLVIGSRYVAGGGVGDWGRGRKFISNFATTIGQKLMRTGVSDPMSGFFMLKREAFTAAAPHLSGVGFKILVDILSSSPRPLKVKELPFTFRLREAGESKLDTMVALEYGFLLADKSIGWLIPVRFISFVAVGSLGMLVHLTLLNGGFRLLEMPFWVAQSLATFGAMVLNFILNNVTTHRDRRLKGGKLVRGLAFFVLVCAFGAFANIGISNHLYKLSAPWWLAGIIGGGISAVWNYGVSSFLVWGTPKRR